MEIKATQRDIRQAPRKVRLVANTVKALSLEDAIRQLAVMQRAATLPVLKTLRQAVANAVHNHGLTPANLRIKELLVNDGPTLKRWRAVSRGRSHSIYKKTCHVCVTLVTTEPEKVQPAAATGAKPAAATKSNKAEVASAAKPVAKPAGKTAAKAKSESAAKPATKTAAKSKPAAVKKQPTKKAAK